MSETVHYKGKLQFLNKLNGEDIETQCKRFVENLIKDGFDINMKYYDSYQEALQYGLDDYEYVIVGTDLYKVIAKRSMDTEYDIFSASNNGDGTFDYEVMYYNGSCSFREAIEEAIDNISR